MMFLTAALAQAKDAAEDRARAESKKAKTAYDLGRFEEALAAYSAAYEAKPLPGFLFNIAQCHRQMQTYEKAIFFYKRYLSLLPKGRDQQTVQDLITECEGKLAEKQRREAEEAEQVRQLEQARLAAAAASRPTLDPASGTAKHTAEDDEPLYTNPWLWTGVGVAAAVVAVGGTTVYFLTRPQAPPASLGTLDAR